MRSDLPRTTVHRSLVQPVLVLGVEREVMALLAGIAGFLLFGFRPNLVTPSLAALVLMVGVPFCRRLNKTDPWTSRVLRRHLATARFYRAQAHPRRRRPFVSTL